MCHSPDVQGVYKLELWRRTFREGVAPVLTVQALDALRNALASDDQRLVQGTTVVPAPLVDAWEVEQACPLAYCGWQGEGLATVGEVTEFFARMCAEIDQRVGGKAECRHFLNWADETPREEMRRDLLAEVEREIRLREKQPV